jgi:Cu2+-exporting ATPase
LTHGRLSLVRWLGDTSLGPEIKALEQTSSHPVARALVAALARVDAARASAIEHQLGVGVRGTVGGRHFAVTAPVAVTSPLPDWAAAGLAQLGAEGLSPVVVAVDGEVRALLGLGDPLREEAGRILGSLRRSGHRLALLSGDRDAVVQHVVSELEQTSGMGALFETARGELGPEAKLAFVEAERARGRRVFMVGDGVNDAAALAAASVGIAVHGGAEASLQAADVFATRPGVAPILELARGARRALHVIHVNLAVSLVYNVVAASLCLAGAITPVWAAVIMPLSSLSVVFHSYRRRMFGAAP